MSKPLDRREFFLTAAPLSAAALALATVSATEARNKPSFRLVTPDGETPLAVGIASKIKVLGKNLYPKFSSVHFKVNGTTVAIREQPPYEIDWTPTETGANVLEAEIFRGTVRIAAIAKSVNVMRVLYDAIGRAVNPLFNAEQSTPSFGMANMTTGIYGFPTNYATLLNSEQIIRRIDAVLCATSGHKTVTNIPFPTNFHYVKARLWNNGFEGFRSSPRSGNAGNYELGAPNTGSTATPVITNSAGIKFYLTGWSDLQIPLLPNVPLALSIQFSHVSPNDDMEFIRFAHSRLAGQAMLYATGFYTNPSVNIGNLGTTLAVRLWTD